MLVPLLPAVWAAVASFIWWRQLSSPWLFAVVAFFMLFGLQSVLAFAWDFIPYMVGNYFLEAAQSQAEIQSRIEAKSKATLIQAAIVLVISVPLLWWLKNALSSPPTL